MIYRIGTMLCIVLWIPAFAERACATVVAISYLAWRFSTLWIDESPMNLYEILGFQPKGVNALSFSS